MTRADDTAQASQAPTVCMAAQTWLAGAEAGLLGVEPPALPTTCLRECVASTGRPCPQLRVLIDGDVAQGTGRVTTCARGHMLAMCPEPEGGRTLVLLQPSTFGEDRTELDLIEQRVQGIRALREHFHRLIEEGHGLALELIRCYEQLNIIFDITKHLVGIQDVARIKLLLITELAKALLCDWACCLVKDQEPLWWCADAGNDRAAILSTVSRHHTDKIDAVVRDRCVVGQRASDGGPSGPSLMFGPLTGDGGNVDVVVLGRKEGRPEFDSGDMRMLDSILGHGGHAIANLHLTERLRSLGLEAIRALVSAIEKKDHYTSGHSERVGFLSHLIGRQMGLSSGELNDLEWAGLVHDVGKIGISDEILGKPGSLTEEEFDVIRQHPRMSFDVIKPVQSFAKVCQIVLHHHEVPDGTGYPDGLKGDEIPLLARILHVADTFDALTSTRPYRCGHPLDKALQIMRNETGPKLDTGIMKAFEAALYDFTAQQPQRFAEIFQNVTETETKV